MQTRTFDPLRWVVPEYLPEGLTLLAGKPKIGKSFLALLVASAVAGGTTCLGQACEQGHVLALCLEDSDRRLQRRLTTMLGAYKEKWPARLKYATEWPRLNEGGIEMLRKWILSVDNPRLIVVDILERVRPRPSKVATPQYSADYQALTALHKLATEFQICILVLHHQRKAAADDLMDTVSGTLGLGGATDTVLILGKDETGNSLYGRGRDLEEFNVAVKLDDHCCWQVLGLKPEKHVSPERAQIISALERAGRSLNVDEITKAIAGKKANVKSLLSKLHFEGEVERVGTGVYRLPASQAEMDLDNENL